MATALPVAHVALTLDRVTDDLLVVELSLGRDLTEDHDHTSLGGSLAGDLGVGVLGEAGVEDGVRDLVTDLVGVALSDRLAGDEQESGVRVWRRRRER